MSKEEITDEEAEALIQRYLEQPPQSEDTGYPQAPSKESMIKFFKEILDLSDEDYQKISRAGNLREEELGRLALHVRAYHNIANYAETENMNTVALYLRKKANIMLNTSLSRKAMFINAIITQKKVSRALGSPKREVQKKMFGGEIIKEEGMTEE